MKKTICKIIGLFSLGLLLFAATDSYAQSSEQKFFQDAWGFMKSNTKDGGAEFRSKYGEKAGDHIVNIVNCGKRKCNLNFRKCLAKETSKKENWIDYICVKNEDAEKYKERGYEEKAAGGVNPGQKTKKKAKKEKDCYEAKVSGDQQSKTYCAKLTGDKVEISSGTEKGRRVCEVIEVSWYNSRNCLFCSLIGVIYAVADDVTVRSYKTFAHSFAIVIAVGLVVWLAFKTLAFVSSLTKQDIAKYFTELFIQSFKFLIAFFALLYYEQIFTMIIRPLIRAGMNFGTTFVLVESIYSRFGEEVHNALIAASSGGGSAQLEALGSKVPFDYIRNANNKFYDVFTYATIENLAYNVNLQYSLLQSIGSGLVCIGFKLLMFFLEYEGLGGRIGLGFACIIYGICFGIFGLLLVLAFIFYLLDAVVQLGIVGAMLPFLVASWPFKLTSKYTKAGFEMLLNSIFIFMMMGVVVNLSIELIKAAIEFNSDGGSMEETENGISALVSALSSLDVVKLNDMVNIVSIGFILFMMANLMAMMLLKKAEELASTFASGAMPSISSNFATQAASTAKGMAKKAAAPVVSGFKEETKELREEIKEGIKSLPSRATRAVGRAVRNIATKAGNSKLGQKVKQSKLGQKVSAQQAKRDERRAKLKEAKEIREAKNAQERQNGGAGGWG